MSLLKRWIFKQYTNQEKEQMQFIHRQYNKCLDLDASEDKFLQMSEDWNTPCFRKLCSTDNYQFTYWVDQDERKKKTTGPLAVQAQELLSKICAYQSERSNRLFRNGYIDDPINLFCENFKEYLSELAHTNATEETLQQVQMRRKFVRRLENTNYFPPGKGNSTNFLELLVIIQAALEARVIAEIKLRIANRRVVDHLESLNNYLLTSLNFGIQFLFYLLQSSRNTPASCTVDTIQFSQKTDMKQAMHSLLGECLRELCMSPSFISLFGLAERSPSATAKTYQIANDFNCICPRNFFLDSSRSFGLAIHPHIPLGLYQKSQLISVPLDINNPNSLRKLEPKPEASVPLYIFSKKYCKLPVGLPGFANDKEGKIVDKILCFHGYLQELGNFALISRQAQGVAKIGGELLIFGTDELRSVMLSFEHLCSELTKTVSLLMTCAAKHHETLRINHDTSEKHWQTNKGKAEEFRDNFLNNLRKCTGLVGHILQDAESKSMEQRKQEAADETEKFQLGARDWCGRIGAMFGMSFISQNLVVDNPKIDDKSGNDNVATDFQVTPNETKRPLSNLRSQTEIQFNKPSILGKNNFSRYSTSALLNVDIKRDPAISFRDAQYGFSLKIAIDKLYNALEIIGNKMEENDREILKAVVHTVIELDNACTEFIRKSCKEKVEAHINYLTITKRRFENDRLIGFDQRLRDMKKKWNNIKIELEITEGRYGDQVEEIKNSKETLLSSQQNARRKRKYAIGSISILLCLILLAVIIITNIMVSRYPRWQSQVGIPALVLCLLIIGGICLCICINRRTAKFLLESSTMHRALDCFYEYLNARRKELTNIMNCFETAGAMVEELCDCYNNDKLWNRNEEIASIRMDQDLTSSINSLNDLLHHCEMFLTLNSKRHSTVPFDKIQASNLKQSSIKEKKFTVKTPLLNSTRV